MIIHFCDWSKRNNDCPKMYEHCCEVCHFFKVCDWACEKAKVRKHEKHCEFSYDPVRRYTKGD